MATIGFYLDILSIFPMNIFADAFDQHKETAASQIANLIPIIQIWHVWDYMSKWERVFQVYVKVCFYYSIDINSK